VYPVARRRDSLAELEVVRSSGGEAYQDGREEEREMGERAHGDEQ